MTNEPKNEQSICELVARFVGEHQRAIAGRPTTDYPDVVLLVETDRGLQWELSVLRDRQRLVPIPNDGPFRLRRVTTH
jgi:hypothetical protein